MATPPSLNTLESFGATEKPELLPGGQETCFRSGNIILKPAVANEETSWIADFYSNFGSSNIRVPKPIHSKTGEFIFDGWQAWICQEGHHKKSNWKEIINVCIDFHKAIEEYPKPLYFAKRVGLLPIK